jgi:hypothetical protein
MADALRIIIVVAAFSVSTGPDHTLSTRGGRFR